MSDTRWHRRLVPAASLAGLIAFAGCAARAPADLEPAETDPDVHAAAQALAEGQAVRREALYAGLDEIALEFQQGVDLIVGGQEILGEEAQASALNRLDALYAECIDLPGCDRSRFVEAFNVLLGNQGIALKQQSARLNSLTAELEAQEQNDREPGTSPFVAAMPELGRTLTLLRGTELRDIISLNGPVSAALDDWLTWMRPLLMRAWENYQFLRAEIAPIYEEAGLPEALLFAMLATETGGKVHSFSRAGAAGPLQFMRFTGRRYGLNQVDGFDMRLDPVAAVRANVAYMNEHFELFDRSLEKALAAYNGGESRMKGLHRRYKGHGFWDSKIYYALPSETREYVPRILAAAWLFMHPEDYNLEFPALDTRIAGLVVVKDTSLSELTVCLGQAEDQGRGWFRTLRNLNPRLEPGDIIEAGQTVRIPEVLLSVYEAQCREGELVARAKKLHDANYPDEPELIPYVVRRGDTLGKIASRLRCASLGELADINRIRPPRYVIRVGQRIRVPSCSGR